MAFHGVWLFCIVHERRFVWRFHLHLDAVGFFLILQLVVLYHLAMREFQYIRYMIHLAKDFAVRFVKHLKSLSK